MIRLDNVSLSYGDTEVLSGLTMDIPDGAHIALMGASGCGKSSVLNLIAGLVKPAGGAVSTGTERIGYVFQEPRLLPWRTAVQNINAVLSDKTDTLPEAAAWLERMGLADAADKYPAQLSGGMRQRVSLARALASSGEVLLLDEPFSGLDEERRDEVIALIRRFAKDKTLVLATHDRTEAEALADRIYAYGDRTFHYRNTAGSR